MSTVVLALAYLVASSGLGELSNHGHFSDGRILEVTSGSTFTVAFPNTHTRSVKILGIDSPVKGQMGFSEARDLLWTLRNTAVELDVVKQEIGGVLVGHVRFVEPGRQSLLYAAYLRSGLVWWNAEEAPGWKEMAEYHREAVDRKLGLWAGDLEPTRPSKFRSSL
jgi:endonuclease YncB( thermonuclease family)